MLTHDKLQEWANQARRNEIIAREKVKNLRCMIILYDPDLHDSMLEKMNDEMDGTVEHFFTGLDLDEATCRYYGWLYRQE